MRFAFALTVSILTLASACTEPPKQAQAEGFRSGVFDPPREAPELDLQGADGSRVSLAPHRGKVVILEFGFTTCATICPVTLAKLVEVHKKLGAAASDVQVIFVTVDPKRDTPERLREYLSAFHPSFLGATGTPEELAAVREAYGVIATEAASENELIGYEVHHSSSIYLIDREGKLRLLSPFGKSADDVLHDVQLLLSS